MDEESVLNPTLEIVEAGGAGEKEAALSPSELVEAAMERVLTEEELEFIKKSVNEVFPPSEELKRAFVDSDVKYGCIGTTSGCGYFIFSLEGFFWVLFPLMLVLDERKKWGYWDACSPLESSNGGSPTPLTLDDCIQAGGGDTFVKYENNSTRYDNWALIMFILAEVSFLFVFFNQFLLIGYASMARLFASRGILVKNSARCFGMRKPRMPFYSWSTVWPLIGSVVICFFVGYLVGYLSEDDSASFVWEEDYLQQSTCNASSVFVTLKFADATSSQARRVFYHHNISSIAYCFLSDNPTSPKAPPEGVYSLYSYVASAISFIPWVFAILPSIFYMYGTLNNSTLTSKGWHKAMERHWYITRMSAIRASSTILDQQAKLREDKKLYRPGFKWCGGSVLFDQGEEAMALRIFFLMHAKSSTVSRCSYWCIPDPRAGIQGPFLEELKNDTD